MKKLAYDISDPEALYKVPLEPGCYIFFDASGEVLYVGKAKELRKRLSSYLRPGGQKPDKTLLMLRRASRFEIILTVSEKEALILEAELIRRHRPKYNVHWRDDKAYPFLRLGIRARFPRLSVVRKRMRDGALYYGPYASAKAVREALRFIASTFGLRTCSDHVMKGRSRPCLQYQIKRCSAPCCHKVDRDAYMDQVNQVRLFLEGKTAHLIKAMTRKMKEAAEECAFEKAAVLRDRIAAIKRISEAQTVVAGMGANWDFIATARDSSKVSVGVLRVREGIVQGQEIHSLDAPLTDPDSHVLSFFIRQYYMDVVPPSEIIVETAIASRKLTEELLSEAAQRRVKIKSSVRSQRARLLKMAKSNALAALQASVRTQQDWECTAAALKEFFCTDVDIDRVEGLDISNTAGQESVGSLVSFLKGKPDKGGYRSYNIRCVDGPDDYESLRQMVRRRLRSGGLPDLFLIDGGRGQLSAVTDVVRGEGGISHMLLASIAKERGEGHEKIFLPGKSDPEILPKHHPVLLFFQRVRDEAHRFGITRHRKKRQKRSMKTLLSSIPGIGPARQRALLRHFGSLKRLREASQSEIESVPSIPQGLAKVIHDHLKDCFNG